jgi:hypothetical protein
MPDVDDQIDRLYQLPLDEFTSARNALAKEAKRPAIKELEKPNIAAWAVNQLYWRHRGDYDRLTKAAERLRAEHKKLLGGKSRNIREPEKDHRDAIRGAVERIKALLTEAGHAASDQTLTAVQETLEALPSGDPAGRLVKPLKPMGFEALAGFAISPAARPTLRVVPSTKKDAEEESPRDLKKERELARKREQEERERKERQRQAQKELKEAEAAMLRAEDGVKKAEKALAESRAKRDEAVSEYQRARLRAHE